MPRLFAGIEIPPTAARELSMLRGGLSGARWIDPENYHITLRFIGDVDNKTARAAVDVLDDIRRDAFHLRIAGLDAFGGRKPHAVHAYVEPNPDLMALQADIERQMQRIGLPAEGRKYHPHVTLARLRGASPEAVANYIQTRGGWPPQSFEVERFVMFSARAGQGGGPYVVEEAYPLSGWAGLYDEEEEGDAAWRNR